MHVSGQQVGVLEVVVSYTSSNTSDKSSHRLTTEANSLGALNLRGSLFPWLRGALGNGLDNLGTPIGSYRFRGVAGADFGVVQRLPGANVNATFVFHPLEVTDLFVVSLDTGKLFSQIVQADVNLAMSDAHMNLLLSRDIK